MTELSNYGKSLVTEFNDFVLEAEAKNPIGVHAEFISPNVFYVEYKYAATDTGGDDETND